MFVVTSSTKLRGLNLLGTTCISKKMKRNEDGEVQAFIGKTLHQILLGGYQLNEVYIAYLNRRSV